MISLNIQLKLIIFSFIFGFFFFMSLKIFNNKTKKYKLIYKILFSFMFLFSMATIYFIGIQKISDVILHIYSLLCIVIGCILYELIEKYNKK